MADFLETQMQNPWFSLGAGILSETQRGVPWQSAIGRGLLSGMQNIRRQEQLQQQAAAQRNLAQLREFEMEQARREAEIAERQTAAREQLKAENPELGTLLEGYPSVAPGLLSAQFKAPKYAMQPIYGTDEEGNLRVFQLGSAGAPMETQFPEGVTPVKPPTTMDLGYGIGIMPPGQMAPTHVIPRGLTPEARPETRAAQEAATTRARHQAEAQTQLPKARTSVARINKQIDELLEHPGLGAGTGFSSILPVVPGTDRADFEARKSQLIGGAFLQAYQELRGGGQITEVEGQKAEQALVRMNAATSEEDFREALEDYRSVIQGGLDRLEDEAESESLTQEPTSGTVVDWSELPTRKRRRGGR